MAMGSGVAIYVELWTWPGVWPWHALEGRRPGQHAHQQCQTSSRFAQWWIKTNNPSVTENAPYKQLKIISRKWPCETASAPNVHVAANKNSVNAAVRSWALNECSLASMDGLMRPGQPPWHWSLAGSPWWTSESRCCFLAHRLSSYFRSGCLHSWMKVHKK